MGAVPCREFSIAQKRTPVKKAVLAFHKKSTAEQFQPYFTHPYCIKVFEEGYGEGLFSKSPSPINFIL
jgi:hypothetical protein